MENLKWISIYQMLIRNNDRFMININHKLKFQLYKSILDRKRKTAEDMKLKQSHNISRMQVLLEPLNFDSAETGISNQTRKKFIDADMIKNLKVCLLQLKNKPG